MSASRIEQETIITTSEADDRWDIYTFNGKLKRKLRAFSQDHPAECYLVKDHGEGAESWQVNKKCLRIVVSRNESRMTEEQKQAARERLQKWRAGQ